MRKHLSSPSRQPGRYWLAISGVLLLALGSQQAGAQAAAPKQAWAWVRPGTLMYLDGKPSTLAEVRQVADDAIGSAEGVMLFGKDSTDYPFRNILAPGAEFITTKANANSPAVLALADRLGLLSGYTEKPATMRMVAPKALAYITSHYPQHWLGGEVKERTQKSTGAVRYRVQLADRWGWRYVEFTPEGEVIENPLASPLAIMLVLALSQPHSTVVPAAGHRDAPLYLDGQRIGPDALPTISPDSLASLVELRGEASQLLTPEAVEPGALIITTKGGQNRPAVAAFNKRVHQLETIQQLAGHSHKAWAATTAPTSPVLQKSIAGEIRYYLNDKPIAEEIVEKLDQNTIASVEVVQGEPVAIYTQDATVGGVVLIKTKLLPRSGADSLRGARQRVN